MEGEFTYYISLLLFVYYHRDNKFSLLCSSGQTAKKKKAFKKWIWLEWNIDGKKCDQKHMKQK